MGYYQNQIQNLIGTTRQALQLKQGIAAAQESLEINREIKEQQKKQFEDWKKIMANYGSMSEEEILQRQKEVHDLRKKELKNLKRKSTTNPEFNEKLEKDRQETAASLHDIIKKGGK